MQQTIPGITRRKLLGGAVGAVVAYAVPLSWSRSSAAAETAPVLVNVFLRGAADGLSLVVPHGDPDYTGLRPTIAIAPSQILDLDGFFGLHPSLGSLEPLYRSGDLAIVHAVGSTDPTRSHFDAQDFMETAAPGSHDVSQGWINRWLATQSTSGAFAGITIGSSRALALAGAVDTMTLYSLDTFQAGDFLSQPRREALTAGFAAGTAPSLSEAAGALFDATDALANVSRATSVAYPPTTFATALADSAALIKASLGVRAIAISLSGWDHHSEANLELPVVASTLADALAAFHSDLGEHAARTLVLTTTEFGRTARENGSGGADHGHASVVFALGGGVRGGRVLLRDGRWPGLAAGDLYEDRDLAVTTDFRDVYAEVLRRHLGVADASALLPGFVADPVDEIGLFA